jgi:hypothetical protein
MFVQKKFKPRQGRQKINDGFICRLCRGLIGLWFLTHGFTVGYYLQRLRRFRNKINLDAAKVNV